MNKRQQESKKPSTVELKSYKLHYDCDCERFTCEDPRYLLLLFFSEKVVLLICFVSHKEIRRGPSLNDIIL